jgi:hypothetical protein
VALYSCHTTCSFLDILELTTAHVNNASPVGEVTVEDLIAVLGKFGVPNPPYDPVKTGKSKNVIDIEDLLELLKTFGNNKCTKPAPPAPPAPPAGGPAPVCANSPRQMCRMMCPPVRINCPAGQCAMRQGSCCSFKCSKPSGGGGGGSSCKAKSACGGQVMTSCGTACPKICGQPPKLMCAMMCVRGYQCPRNQWWDGKAGRCVSRCSGTPGLVIGRPFIVDTAPMMASAVQTLSPDWL